MCKIFTFFLGFDPHFTKFEIFFHGYTCVKRSLIHFFITQKPSLIVQNSLCCISFFLFPSKNIFFGTHCIFQVKQIQRLVGFMLKMAKNIFCLGTTEWNIFSWKNKHAVVKGYFVGFLGLQKLQVEHKIWIVFHQSLKFDYQLSDYSDYSDLAFTSIIQHKLEKPRVSNHT